MVKTKQTKAPKLSKKEKKRQLLDTKSKALIEWGLNTFKVGDWVQNGSQIGQIISMTPLYKPDGVTVRAVEIWVKTYGSENWIKPDGSPMTEGYWLPGHFAFMTKIDEPTHEPEVHSLQSESIDIAQFVPIDVFEKIKEQETLIADSKDANPELRPDLVTEEETDG